MQAPNCPNRDSCVPLLLKAKQTAETLAISERKLWGMTARGLIPHIKIGRSVRYPAAELGNWIQSKMNQEVTSENA